jgi:hypothetical protein
VRLEKRILPLAGRKRRDSQNVPGKDDQFRKGRLSRNPLSMPRLNFWADLRWFEQYREPNSDHAPNRPLEPSSSEPVNNQPSYIMATTPTLNAKYPDWTQEDRDRFDWINSWDRRRRNLARLSPSCKRCGTAAVFKENHADMPYHNVFKLGCPKCHQCLENTTDLSPVQLLDGCTLSVVQNRVPLHMVRQWNFYNSPSAQRKSAKLY